MNKGLYYNIVIPVKDKSSSLQDLQDLIKYMYIDQERKRKTKWLNQYLGNVIQALCEVRGQQPYFLEKNQTLPKALDQNLGQSPSQSPSQPVYLYNMLYYQNERGFQALCMWAPNNSFMTIHETCLDAEIK